MMVLYKYACSLTCLSQKDIMLVTASPSEKRFIYHAVTDLSHSELSYKYFVLFTVEVPPLSVKQVGRKNQ